MAEVEYADALRQHLVAALNEVLAAKPDDPFKSLQKILFAASLGDGTPPEASPVAQDADMKEYLAKFGVCLHAHRSSPPLSPPPLAPRLSPPAPVAAGVHAAAFALVASSLRPCNATTSEQPLSPHRPSASMGAPPTPPICEHGPHHPPCPPPWPDLETHIADVIAKKGKGSGPMSGVKFMISDAGDFFTELSKKLKAAGGQPMTAEELKAMDAAAAKAKREKDAREQAERDAKDAENAKRAAEMEAQGKSVGGGLHKFDKSEVDVNGGTATADDFMDAFGF